MPASNPEFDCNTTGDAVVAAFSAQVKDKIILITGANPGGIGLSTAVSLARASPKLLIIAGRNAGRLESTTRSIKTANPDVSVIPLNLDLSSQASCKAAADSILSHSQISHIDILINNAGVMNIPDRTLSPDGIEMQFATNHIGHFLFTNLIASRLITASKTASPGSTRIINVSSRAVLYGPVRLSDYNFTKPESTLPESEHMSQLVRQQWNEHEDKPYIAQAAYGQSKSANVLFSRHLNDLLYEKHGIQSIAVHPGGIMTELGRHMDQEVLKAAIEKMKSSNSAFHMKDLEEGCSTTLTAALDPKLRRDDLFLADCQVVDWVPAYATDPELAGRLWKLSEELVGQQFAY